ncbi:MAG: O-antigen ligase family protein, partial [Candidatus Auribacterota bacterium]|nr:O-antigen ligase family protein [Candidatus Auribacterota bacterium]
MARGWILWLLVSLVVFACLPGMMSANYLPKTIWAALTIAVGLAVIRPRSPARIILTPLGVVWAGYMAWALISLIWAVQPRVGLERWLALLLPTLAYLLAKRTRFWESELFWRFFYLMTGLVALIGILQYFFPSLPFVHIFPGTAVPRATMGQRNYTSMYLVVTIPFILKQYLRTRGWRLLIPLFAFIFAILFLLLARTRGAWIGLLIGFVYLLIAGGVQRILVYKQKLIFLLIPVAMVLLVALSTGLPIGKKSGFRGKKNFGQTAESILDLRQRLNFWQPCLVVTDPILGAGFGNFPIIVTPYSYIKEEGVKALNWEVHNDYLQAYVDLGLPGVVLFCLVVGFMLRLAWRGRRSGIILASGAAVAGLAVMQFTTFTSEKVSTLVWIAGVAAIINSQVWIRPYISRNIYRGLVLTGNYLLVLWLVIFAVIVGYTIRGDLIFFKAKSIVQRAIRYEQIFNDHQGISDWEIESLRQELPFLRVEVGHRLHILANRILPTMHFDANMKHIICSQFGRYAMELKDYPDAAIFARKAFLLHPADRISLKRLCIIKLITNQHNQAINLLSQGIELFGYSPHQSYFCDRLIEVYEYLQMPEWAEYIRDKMQQNKVSKPQNPSPKNRSTGVPIDIIFDWNDCNAALSYELYLWRNGEKTPPAP